MNDDLTLLQRYADLGDDEAFSTLVRRNLNLVWGAARRITADDDLARDVAQTVFTDLARKARRLPRGTMLAGWLHRAATHAASNLVRTHVRRAARESQAMQLIDQQTPDPEAVQLKESLLEALDEGLQSLGEVDRNALVLRFLGGRSLAEVGVALGTGEDAAQKRVSRALDRLREWFTRRQGKVATTALLSTVLNEAGSQAAPAGLAGAVTSAALAGAAGGTAGALAWFKVKWVLPLAAVTMALPLLWFPDAWTGWWSDRKTAEPLPVTRATVPPAEVASARSGESASPGPPAGLQIPLRPRAAAPAAPRTPSLVATRPPAPADPAAQEFERASALTLELENQLVMQVQHYLLQHDQMVPPNLEALVAATSPNVEAAKLAQALIHFEFVSPPEGTTKASDGLHLFRERKPRRRDDGEWVRNYVTGAGGSRVATLQDTNFEAWERRWLPGAPRESENSPAAQPR